ncbi:ABC transporter permease [Kitasatospora sp. NPDC004531]
MSTATETPPPAAAPAVAAPHTWPRAAARAAAVVAHRDIVRQLGRPGPLLSQLLQLVFFLLVYAVGFNGMVGAVDGVPFSAYVFPGILAIQTASACISSGMSFAWDREFGFLREMLVAPVPRWSLALGKAAGSIVPCVVQGALTMLLAPIAGVRIGLRGALLGLAAVAVTATVFCGVGLLAALLLRRVETLQQVVQLLMFPLLFLSGSVFRPDQVPHWLSTAIWFNPLSYAVDLLRQALISTPGGGHLPHLLPAGADLAALAALAVVLAVGIRRRLGR